MSFSSFKHINKNTITLGYLMKISHLFEFVEEDFKSMSQKATNIAQGKGNATDAELRQQRIAQLAANQKARNAAPAGKPMAQQQAAPAQTQAPAQDLAQQQPAQQGQPAQGGPATTSIGQKAAGAVGGVSKAIGAVGGGIAGAFNKIKQGYQAGKGAVSGSGGAPAQISAQAPAQEPTQANPEIAQLTNRVSALEKAVGIAESYKFESRFLKMDI
jgi:hypothetical protein